LKPDKPDKPLISFHLDVGKEERIKLFCAVRIWRTQIINYSMGFCGLAFLFLMSQPFTSIIKPVFAMHCCQHVDFYPVSAMSAQFVIVL
jgi:hypothetical protein